MYLTCMIEQAVDIPSQNVANKQSIQLQSIAPGDSIHQHVLGAGDCTTDVFASL